MTSSSRPGRLPEEPSADLLRRTAEKRMAQDVDEFYGDQPVPLPIGVRHADSADG